MFRINRTSGAFVLMFFILLCSSSFRQNNPPQTGAAATFNATGTFYALSVPDLEASIKWYTEKLGMKVVLQTPKKDGFALALLDGGGFAIELVQYDAAVPLSSAAPSIRQSHMVHGIYKAGILVDDLQKVIDYLKEKNVEIVMGPYPGRAGRRSNLAIKDNSGNLIMFLGK